ncbi:MAG: hypothetical protein AB1476_06560 [Candidatus Hadarchaeota archaeon]
MRIVHYQTLEPVGSEDLAAIRRIREGFNDGKGFWDRIKLWRKSDVLEGLQPRESRWGFTRAKSEKGKLALLGTLQRISEATPGLTWVIYDDGNGGKELILKGGRAVA